MHHPATWLPQAPPLDLPRRTAMRKVTIRFSDEDVDALDSWRETRRDPETGGPPSRAAALRLIVRRALRQSTAHTEQAPATRADIQKLIDTILAQDPDGPPPGPGKVRRARSPALVRRR